MNVWYRSTRNLVTGAAFTCCLIATVFAQDEELVGDWDCTFSMTEEQLGMSVNVEVQQSYAADGSYNRDGELTISMPAMEIESTITIDEAGSWSREGMSIIEERSGIEFASTSDEPDPITLMLLAQMEAEAGANSTEVSQIESLTATTLVISDGEGGLNCQRA